MKKDCIFNNIFRFRFFLIVIVFFLDLHFYYVIAMNYLKCKNHLFEEKIIEQPSQNLHRQKKKSVVSQNRRI